MLCIKPQLDNLQFAYLPNRATVDAINTLVHEIAQHADKKQTHTSVREISAGLLVKTI